MMREVRELLISEMVDLGELISKGDDLYEDMGGHVVHESNLDGHIEQWLKDLDPVSRAEVTKRIYQMVRDVQG